jgi:hypothetical protein
MAVDDAIPAVVPPAQGARATAPVAAPAAAQAAAPPTRDTSSWQNIRLDFTITDTFGNTPSKKTVTMLIADRGQGRIRSSNQVKGPTNGDGYQPISINIDATATLPSARDIELQSRNIIPKTGPDMTGKIMLNLTVQYTPEISLQGSSTAKPASLDESLNVVVQDGKPTLLSQSADPQGDRKVTLEVTATIVK